MIKKKKEKITGRKETICFVTCLFILFGFNILYNAWIVEGNRVFYLDDLSVVNVFLQSKNWIEFSFMKDGNKLRPVSMAAIYSVLKLSAANYELIDETLLALNFLNAVLVFEFVYQIIHIENKIVRMGMALTGGTLFIASHFSYYNISELLGIMEGLGVLFALGIQLALILYIQETTSKRYMWFGLATVLYAFVIYTHERYFVLIGLFIAAVLAVGGAEKKKDYKWALVPASVMISYWAIRFVLFSGKMLYGTGGTDIKETFNIVVAIKFCFSQIGYILGIQCGPQYLNGVSAGQVPLYINIVLGIKIFVMAIIFVLFLRLLIIDEKFKSENIKLFLMFLMFIALCIASSSVTIRVEMRWIYVSYAMFVILLIYVVYAVIKQYQENSMMLMAGAVIILIVTLFVEQYYRGHYCNLYYWGTKDFSRELVTTLERYKDEMEEREVLIISESPAFGTYGENEWNLLFRPYVDNRNINITYVNNIFQGIEKYTDYSIILVEDVENREYTDITQLFSHINRTYGVYEDGWCEPNCEFTLYGNTSGNAILSFYYPEDIEIIGFPKGTIIINNKEEKSFEMTENVMSVEVELVPYQVNTVQLALDYWVIENSGRSEDGRLSCTLAVYDD